jgi:hypothetical protein
MSDELARIHCLPRTNRDYHIFELDSHQHGDSRLSDSIKHRRFEFTDLCSSVTDSNINSNAEFTNLCHHIELQQRPLRYRTDSQVKLGLLALSLAPYSLLLLYSAAYPSGGDEGMIGEWMLVMAMRRSLEQELGAGDHPRACSIRWKVYLQQSPLARMAHP